MICFMAIAGLIFRSELILLFGPVILQEVFMYRRLSLRNLLLDSLKWAPLCLVATVLVDSYFWRRWLYPEGEVLFFNTVENQSSKWGTSPWPTYLTHFLPKLLLGGMPLAVWAIVRDWLWMGRRGAVYWVPAVVFVLLYSFLPHKEWRFIIYIVPLFNLMAAHAMDTLYPPPLHTRCFISFTAAWAVDGRTVTSPSFHACWHLPVWLCSWPT